MFQKYFFHRLLGKLPKNVLPQEKDIWFDDRIEIRITRLYQVVIGLQKYEILLNEECKNSFKTLQDFLLRIQSLLKKRNYPELIKIDINLLNNLILAMYECFHSTEAKKRQTINEIKKRLKFYGVDSDIEISASHRPEKGEAFAKADI